MSKYSLNSDLVRVVSVKYGVIYGSSLVATTSEDKDLDND